MMKFFRKYTKQMLAVFLALLLVVWLGGTALENFLQPNPGKTVIAYANGQKIRGNDLSSAAAEARILRSMLGMVGLRPWVHLGAGFRGRLMALKELEPIDWMLLRDEAGRENISVTQGEVDELLDAVDSQRVLRNHLQETLYVSDDDIRKAVADYLRVIKLGKLVGSAVHVSEAELKREIADMEEKVEVRMVLLDSETFKDPSAAVSEEDLQKHFEAYRDKPRDAGRYGFGYQYPERVKIQYLSVNTKALAERSKVTEQQARNFWKANKELAIFEKPKAATQPATGSAPATTRATTQEKPEYYESFAEAKEITIKHLQEEKAKEEAQRLLNEIISKDLSYDFSTATDAKDGYRNAPAAVKAPEYWSAVFERALKRGRLEGVMEKHEPEKLVTREELAEMKGIGGARLASGGRGEEIPLAELAFQVQGLTAIPQGEAIDRSHYTSLYETFPSPLADGDGNYYIFRIVQAEKPRAPGSLAEVADKVKEDLLTLRAHEAAGRVAERIAKEAREKDLQAAWGNEEDLRKKVGPNLGYLTPRSFSRKGWNSAVPGIGMNETFTEACFALAGSNPTAQADRIRVVEMPSVKKWAVVEYVSLHPTAKDRYERMRTPMREQLAVQKRDDLFGEWFRAENIRERNKFSPAKEKGEAPEEEG